MSKRENNSQKKYKGFKTLKKQNTNFAAPIIRNESIDLAYPLISVSSESQHLSRTQWVFSLVMTKALQNSQLPSLLIKD